MVQVADGVCGLCVKSHTSGAVSVVYRYSQLPPDCDKGDGFDLRVTEI